MRFKFYRRLLVDFDTRTKPDTTQKTTSKRTSIPLPKTTAPQIFDTAVSKTPANTSTTTSRYSYTPRDAFDESPMVESEIQELRDTYVRRLREFGHITPKSISYYGDIQSDVLLDMCDEVYGVDAYTIYVILLPCQSKALHDHIQNRIGLRENIITIDYSSCVCFGGHKSGEWNGNREPVIDFICEGEEILDIQRRTGLYIAKCEQALDFYDVTKNEFDEGYELYENWEYHIVKTKFDSSQRTILFPGNGFARRLWRLANRGIESYDYHRCVTLFDEFESTDDPQYKRVLEY